MVVAYFVRGFEVASFSSAMIAALVIGLINATLGFILKVLTFPLTLVTFGVFWFVINAIMLEIAAAFVPGFYVRGFLPALFGAVVLSIVNLIFKTLAKGITDDRRRARFSSFLSG